MTATALAQKTCPRCGLMFDADAVFCAKDGTKLEPDGVDRGPDSDPYIGTVISEDIELLSVAGAGAMGRVYRAHQRGIDRDVAVKILHREMSGNAQLVQRFHREAKIASKLQHPHVVEVYLAGQLPDKALYIVMEFLDGMSLAAALAESGGVFPAGRALSIAFQICDAVGEGHARGIVHRDLKPENVMLVRRADMGDWAKVLDFGIAKVNLGEQSMQTQAGLVFGTARYISPEGAQGTNVGPPGDVYSLATIIYQMLAGRTPFDAEPLGLLIKHIHEAPPPLTSWPRAAETHPALAKVIMDNLAKDPAKRAPGARAFAAQLAAAAKEAGINVSEVGVVARLSNIDLNRASSLPLDPTLDDISQLTTKKPDPTLVLVTSPPPAIVKEPSSPPAELPTLSAPPPVIQPSEPAPKKRPTAVILLSFLLGIALTVIATQYVGKHGDDDHATLVKRSRRALTDSKFVNPPGDNVRELVTSGLAKFPDDPELAQIRTEASHEMVTRALAANTGGDVIGARDLVRDALALDPNDHSARTLFGQYQQELESLSTDSGMYSGAPKVTFESAALARPAQRLVITAHIIPGSTGPKAKVTHMKLTLYENGKTTGGIDIPHTSADPHALEATLVAPKVGSYDLIFEAAVEGRPIRAQRDLDVVP